MRMNRRDWPMIVGHSQTCHYPYLLRPMEGASSSRSDGVNLAVRFNARKASKMPLVASATIEHEQTMKGTQASLRDAGRISRVHRGFQPTAKFTSSLRDEENAAFVQSSG